ILGSSMSNKMWETVIEHAKTCVLSGKLYVYYADETRTVAVVFNHIYELSGLIASDQYYPADSLSDSQKVYVDTLMKKAYDNWDQVLEYDGKSLLGFKQNKKSTSSMLKIELPSGSNSYPPRSLDNQMQLQRLPASVHSETASVEHNMLIG
ncbi:calmodulin-binding protein, partial [Genlisea aurea]